MSTSEPNQAAPTDGGDDGRATDPDGRATDPDGRAVDPEAATGTDRDAGASAADTDTGRTPRRRRRTVWALAATALLLLAGYVGAAAALAGRVPGDVDVAGVQVGGTTRAEAVERLREGLGPLPAVPVRIGEAEATLDPAAAGLGVDAEATAEQLVGFTLDPRALWRHVDGQSRAEPVTTVAPEQLRGALSDLAEQHDAAPVEGQVGFADGEPQVTEASAGWALDVDAAADQVADDWFGAQQPLDLETEQLQPTIDADDVQSAVEDFAEPATAGPLVVRVGERSVELAPAQVTPALGMVAKDGELAPTVDAATLHEAVRAADGDLVREPQDARIVLQDGRPAIEPSRDGTRIDPASLAVKARDALATPERTVTVDPVVAEPDLTTEGAEALGVTEEISQFATPLTSDADRTENLRIAARTVSGTLLMPGETFSLNGTLGERTRAKGYNAAGFISNGRLRDTVGGGVSQMATTLFNGMFFAGLEDVYHQPHSFYISRYPEGREATINWPTIDLKFRNDSGHGVLIDAWVADGEVHTRFWGTKRWQIEASKGPRHNIVQPERVVDDSAECTPQSPNIGFDVDVERRFVRGGEVQRTETFSTRYLPSTGVTCT